MARGASRPFPFHWIFLFLLGGGVVAGLIYWSMVREQAVKDHAYDDRVATFAGWAADGEIKVPFGGEGELAWRECPPERPVVVALRNLSPHGWHRVELGLEAYVKGERGSVYDASAGYSVDMGVRPDDLLMVCLGGDEKAGWSGDPRLASASWLAIVKDVSWDN